MSSHQCAANYICLSSLSVRHQIAISQALCANGRYAWHSLQCPLLEKDAQSAVLQVKQSHQTCCDGKTQLTGAGVWATHTDHTVRF